MNRLFMQDWWNSSNFAGYYRTWNVVVHDWLYSYIYKDVYKVRTFPFLCFVRHQGICQYITHFNFVDGVQAKHFTPGF